MHYATIYREPTDDYDNPTGEPTEEIDVDFTYERGYPATWDEPGCGGVCDVVKAKSNIHGELSMRDFELTDEENERLVCEIEGW